MNERIRAREVRLIDQNGTQVGIVPLSEALARAEEVGLDLVEVSPNVNPPVCKLMDYGKYKYEQKQKAKEAKKNATSIQVKEIRLRPKTDRHDVETKIQHIRRFISHGDKAKITVSFRGREIAHTDKGREILDFILESLRDEVQVEVGPKMEGKNMIMILAPPSKR